MDFERLISQLAPVAAPVLIAVLACYLGLKVLQKSLRRAGLCPADFSLVGRLYPAMLAVIVVFGARAVESRLHLVDASLVKDAFSAAAIWAVAYLLMRCVWAGAQLAYAHNDIEGTDNLSSRRVRTQLQFLEKVGHAAIVFLAMCATMLLFDGARSFGESLLASAGVAGIIIGFAAQKSLANLIAGLQIAFTQPLRIEDAVVVEGEWGWVEEINLTYVVVRVWDQRRLVLPITYFVEKPFQNWTRTNAQILGSVFVEASHRVPFAALEAELNRLLENTPLWDRDKRVLQMVEANERSVTLRALMTAKDSPTCWDLRCHVRRGLIEYLQREHPEAIPVVRLEEERAGSRKVQEEAPTDGRQPALAG